MKIFTKYMLLGQKVKNAINEAGLTTEDVAYKIDMSSNNLYRLYKKDSFEIKYLIKIAEIVKKPLSYFISELDQEERGQYNLAQGGIGNQAGNNNKQKIMPIHGKEAFIESSDINLNKLQHELELCQRENSHLKNQISLQEDLIEVLKKNQK
ncbi:helix-turn-helix transcriptional regulator [Adhaeribacter pallidiroseus]|uniref:helix-turn-helix transcriptional regulator n=1 Tax=Adhaeribacter pallidiroseus TaxID=2072847 RepID=UPI0011C01B24|nr:helix-turn-helix transcriptional regulator [Adhaeribacter pallidiroseus]